MSITFKFNNISNEKYSLKYKESNHKSKPSKRIEFEAIPGRTGDLIISDGSRENLQLEIICYIDGRKEKDLNELSNEIDQWLNGHEGYKPLIFSDGIKFLAVYTGQINIDTIIKNFGEIRLVFSCKPYEEEI